MKGTPDLVLPLVTRAISFDGATLGFIAIPAISAAAFEATRRANLLRALRPRLPPPRALLIDLIVWTVLIAFATVGFCLAIARAGAIAVFTAGSDNTFLADDQALLILPKNLPDAFSLTMQKQSTFAERLSRTSITFGLICWGSLAKGLSKGLSVGIVSYIKEVVKTKVARGSKPSNMAKMLSKCSVEASEGVESRSKEQLANAKTLLALDRASCQD